MIQGESRWLERGSASFPATIECGESLTATCLTLIPKEIRAQSDDATDSETSGPKSATSGRSDPILSMLALSWSSGSFPPRTPTNVSSSPVS